MYGKWPFPEATAEGAARLRELEKQELNFRETEPSCWICNELPDLKLELGDYPDDPMYFVWEKETCIGYFDGPPGTWKVEGMSGKGEWLAWLKLLACCGFMLAVLGSAMAGVVWLIRRLFR